MQYNAINLVLRLAVLLCCLDLTAGRIVHRISDFNAPMAEPVRQCRAICLVKHLQDEINNIVVTDECTDRPNCFMCWDYCKILHEEKRIVRDLMCSDVICTMQLLLERARDAHSDGRHRVHLPLDPRSDSVRLFGELAAQHLVVLLLAQLVRQRLVTLRHQRPHLRPLPADQIGRQGGVRVDQPTGHLLLLDDRLGITHQPDDDVELLVRLAERRLELIVRLDQALDLLHRVHDEHVHEILAGSIQPVVERCRTLGELQVEQIDLLQDALGFVQSLAAALGEHTKTIPLVADALAARIHRSTIVVLQGATKQTRTKSISPLDRSPHRRNYSLQLLRDRRDLLDAILVGGQIRLERLLRKSCDCSISSLPLVQSSCVSALCLNFWARCSRRSRRIVSASSHSSNDFSACSSPFQALVMSDTILPSVGMYAGRFDRRSFVCSVLKFVSSFAFCSTRGGLCLRRYVLYSSSFFCTPASVLSDCLELSHGIVRRIHSRS
uniref:Uncharacterized protein n=1 Tax=Anopheles atroparvus TaxID=41427 RepID=A0A182JFR8_ANOAO